MKRHANHAFTCLVAPLLRRFSMPSSSHSSAYGCAIWGTFQRRLDLPRRTLLRLLPRRPLGPYGLRVLRVFCTRSLDEEHKRRSQNISKRMFIQIAKPESRSIREMRGGLRFMSCQKRRVQRSHQCKVLSCKGLKGGQELRRRGK